MEFDAIIILIKTNNNKQKLNIYKYLENICKEGSEWINI